MIVINKVEYSKNPIEVSETFLLMVSIREIFATWNDMKIARWNNVSGHTWRDMKMQVLGPWSRLNGDTWGDISNIAWKDTRTKLF